VELVVEGDQSHESGLLWLQWSEVSGLLYMKGDEERSKGLYALKGIWESICLVPNVNDAQAAQIIHTIYSHFPYVAMAEGTGPPGSLLRNG
jgi:hypothetical protein